MSRHLTASARHRRADAVDHHHAQLLHDAAGAGRAVRPGTAHPAGDPAQHREGLPSRRVAGAAVSALSRRPRCGRLRPVLPDQGLHRRPAAGEGAPASFKVGGLAVLLAIFLGLPAGVVAALRHNSWADYSVMALAMIGIAIPSFVMAPLLTLVFGVYLGWLPVGGWGGGAPAVPDPAGGVAGPATGGAGGPAGARRHDRAAECQLCADGARQGPARATGAAAPRAPRRAAAGGVLSRADDRGAGHRLGGDRDHLQHPGHRPLLRAERR